MNDMVDALVRFSDAMARTGATIGDSVAYVSYTRSIERLRIEKERRPLFSWGRYVRHREIQRLTKLKSDVEKRRGEA